jgi:putative endonuclease
MKNKMIGCTGENMACDFLQRRGYRILERNYRSPRGEVDIVAARRGILIFCEVKARSTGGMDEVLEAVDKRKQARIAGVAEHYLACRRPRVNRCRFDVIGLLKKGSKWRIEHVEDAFEIGEL